MTAFVRISPFAPFPGRTTYIDLESLDVLHPLTYAHVCGPSLAQQIAFVEVDDDLAAELATIGFRGAFPITDDNPARFEIVKTQAEALKIEAGDLRRLQGLRERGAMSPLKVAAA